MNEITVYIVEDYELTRKNYIAYFSGIKDIKILGTFETAEECLEAMKSTQADIILMDLGLPAMNGIEATKIINSKYPSTNVVILTSHDRKDEIYASLASGAKGYTLKDIDLKELVGVIHQVYKGNLLIDQRIARAALKLFPIPDSTSNFEDLYKPHVDEPLTDRELEVLKLMSEGKSNIEIAKAIHISQHTAKSHVCKILTKLAVSDRVQAAVKAVKYHMF